MDILSMISTIIGIVATPVYDTIKSTLSPVDRAYKKALQKWIKNNDIRERTARSRFYHWTLLKEYIISPDRIADKDIISLLDLWKKELEKDSEAINLIQYVISEKALSINKENNTILKNIQNWQSEAFRSLEEKIENLGNEVKSFNESSSRKVYESKPNYIPRNVYHYISEGTPFSFLKRAQNESKPLLDYLIEDKIGKSTQSSPLNSQ